MAVLEGYTQLFSGDTTIVDTAAMMPLGTRGFDKLRNEYIYCKGVVNTVAGSAAVYDYLFATTLATSASVGLIGIAMAAIVASSYGWYQITGAATVQQTADTTAGSLLYTTATAGKTSNTSGGQTQIKNAVSAVTTTASAATGTALIQYPSLGIA